MLKVLICKGGLVHTVQDCKYACLTHSIKAPSVSGAVVPFGVMARFTLFGQ